jgi:hypothetical protein
VDPGHIERNLDQPGLLWGIASSALGDEPHGSLAHETLVVEALAPS